MNNGGIRTGLAAGPATYARVFEVSPFQNELVRIRLTGRDMRVILEEVLKGGAPSAHISGLLVTYDPARAAGRRVKEVRLLNGKRLEDRAMYTLSCSDFLAGGKGGYTMLPALAVERTGVIDTDALVNYLRRLPQPVEPPADPRFVVDR